jgi:hypothetical protein
MITDPSAKDVRLTEMNEKTQSLLGDLLDCSSLKDVSVKIVDGVMDSLASLEQQLVTLRTKTTRAVMTETDMTTRRDIEATDAKIVAALNLVRDMNARFIELGRLTTTLCSDASVVVSRAVKRGYADPSLKAE